MLTCSLGWVPRVPSWLETLVLSVMSHRDSTDYLEDESTTP